MSTEQFIMTAEERDQYAAQLDTARHELSEVERWFLWQVLARDNPALPPRRRAVTARSWAIAIRHICLWLSGDAAAQWGNIRVWAARTLLDAASQIEAPPEYELLQLGSCRRHAQDAGGIEGQLLLQLAAVVVDRASGHISPLNDQLWRSWRLLYPETAEPELASPEAMVQEWELLYGTFSVTDDVRVSWGGTPDFSDIACRHVLQMQGIDCNGDCSSIAVVVLRPSVADVTPIVRIHVYEGGLTAPEMVDVIMTAIESKTSCPLVAASDEHGDDAAAVLLSAIARTVHG